MSKTGIALLCLVVMMVGFLVSRAALSIAIIVFGANALRDIHPRKWLSEKWWLLAVAWVGIYIISYFWSGDAGYWKDRVEVKLPVVLLPLAFAYLPAFTARQLKIFTISIATALLLSIAYSLFLVLNDPAYYIDRYYMSNVIPVLAKKDYIRYSLTLTLFTIWCFYYWPRLDSKAAKWFVGISISVFIAFLHFLAARTGLLALYIFLIIWGIYAGLRKGKVFALIMAAGIGLTLFLSARYIPTLKKKIDYIYYSYDMYKQGDRSGLYSDIGRIISYDVAFKVVKEHPMTGVGAGDMQAEMAVMYERWYKQVAAEHRLLPHNQFLIVTLAGGIPALVLFTLWVFAPLRRLRRNRKSLFFFCVWLVLLLPLLIEPMLEVQFGVFVYLFFLLWQRHAFIHDADEESRNDIFTTSKEYDQLHPDISA